MVRHVAVFSFKEGTTAEQVRALAEGLASLPALVPEIRSYRFGPDLGLGGNASFAVVAEFDDAEGYQAYASHPAHLAVAADLVGPLLASRLSVQFSAG